MIEQKVKPMTAQIILIHPPLAKCPEPPAGIARLSACLTENQIACDVIDANLEGILFMIKNESSKDTSAGKWTTRARKNLDLNLAALQDPFTYRNQSRYQKSVMDINRLLSIAGQSLNADLSLADYQDKNLSPVKSADLFMAAEKPQMNPFFRYFQKRLTEALSQSPGFIGFSVNYLSQALSAFAMIGFIKKIHPGQKIILGGSLITSWMKLGATQNTFSGLVDEMVEGAGEKKLLELLNVKDGIHNAPPDYNHFPLDQYLSPGRVLPYSGARGCYWHTCAFCPEKAEGNHYQPLSVSQATGDLRKLVGQIRPALIHILDSSMSPLLLKALAQNPPGTPWYGFARATRHLADENFCLSLKNSGCVMLKLGIESGDQVVLDRLNKGIDLPAVSAILKTLKKFSIAAYCYFLFGTPPENEESALKTMDFVIRHHDCIDFLNLAIFNLPARSTEAKALATHDFYAGDLSLYRNFDHPAGWNRSVVRKFLENIFKKHPAIAPLVKRTPPFFTSNHAPFFILHGC